MNSAVVEGSAASVKQPPRPPAVGEVGNKFHDFIFFECRKRAMEQPNDAADFCKNNTTQVPENLRTSPNYSPPLPTKGLLQSLQLLLEDKQGVSLFEQFLKEEGHDTKSLSFWFACRGVKKTDPLDRDKLLKLIQVVYEKKAKRISAISSQTKSDIKLKLTCHANIDVNIFDAAQNEVEVHMAKTTYPNFLNSDIYLQSFSKSCESSCERDCAMPSETSDFLPTVHEDSVLNLSLNKSKNKFFYQDRSKIAPMKTRPEQQAGLYLKSPYASNYSAYHTRYSSFLPASAQDSELQSLSSDAQTDDTMSQTDSSVDYSMYSRNKQKRHPKGKMTYINKDVLQHGNFLPRTLRLPEKPVPKSPEEFHSILVKKLCRVIEERKTKEKVTEKLKMIEDCTKPEALPPPPAQKLSPQRPSSSAAPVLEINLLLQQAAEENVDDILDKHMLRVFSGMTPIMSPGFASPPVLLNEDQNCAQASAAEVQKVQRPSHLAYFPSRLPISHTCRKDPDTRSNDSGAVTEWLSEEHLTAGRRAPDCSSNADSSECGRRCRESLRRGGGNRRTASDSASSCFDSGVSMACEAIPSHSKVTHWLEAKRCASESEKEHLWKNSSTSPVLSKSRSRASHMGHSRSMDIGNIHSSLVPAQPIVHDPSMPALPPPDTTTNLLEAKRRLEDEQRLKMKTKFPGSRSFQDPARIRPSARFGDFTDDGISHRKQSRKSCPSGIDSIASNSLNNDSMIVGYSFGMNEVPFLTRMQGRSISLRQFKLHINKKGKFKYFCKTMMNTFSAEPQPTMVEVMDDNEVLHLYEEGKIFVVLEPAEETD